MTDVSNKTIHADEARRKFKVAGDGIVWAVLDTGIHRDHVHFAKHENLTLPPGLHHADFSAPELSADLREQEALVDLLGYGTHSAGIICGESTDKNARRAHLGIAPKCKVLSVKVFDENSATSEFQVLAALEWIRSASKGRSKPLIHGVMMNAGLNPDVRNYACGLTPVCRAVNELVEAGVVVVAPAGNGGYRDDFGHPPATLFGSIADPGNAERAITVGATHRRFPHDYGASFFSSRGPTMDGRLKPDILAPGEKITSCWIDEPPPSSNEGGDGASPAQPHAGYQTLDGTVMAAAHVSGAIALLLSARPELIGRPAEVKQLLMMTATDLGRVPWAQGSGLVDVVSLIARAQKPLKAATPSTVPAQARQPKGKPGAGSTEKVILADAAGEPGMVAAGGKRFVFGISYPGTHRDLVSDVVFTLRRSAKLKREQILFDRFHEAEFARPNLSTYLPNLYVTQSELVVVFLGGDYRKSRWCGLEWEAIRDVIAGGGGPNIMPLRLDLADIPGLDWTDGYMDVSDRDPEEIADKILDRLKLNRAAAGSDT